MRFLLPSRRWIGSSAWLALGLLHLTSGSALTQQLIATPTELTDYERVRVQGEHLSPRILVGQVIHADPSGQVTLRVDDQERAVDLLRAEHVQVLTGRQRGRSALIGGGTGVVIGMLVGGIGYYALRDPDDLTSLLPNHERVFRSMEVAIVGGALGAVAGAAIGAVIGYPKWESVRLILEPQREATTPQRMAGMAIGVRWTP